jgi:hypothetical protein
VSRSVWSIGVAAVVFAATPVLAGKQSNPVLQAIDYALPGDLINVVFWARACIAS